MPNQVARRELSTDKKTAMSSDMAAFDCAIAIN
jgi:hypothetical protein